MGTEQVRAFYEGIFSAFSDISLVSDDELVNGDKVVTRSTMGVTHTGSREHHDDEAARERDHDAHFEGGKCVERWSSFDFLGLLMQLGVVLAAAGAERQVVGDSRIGNATRAVHADDLHRRGRARHPRGSGG